MGDCELPTGAFEAIGKRAIGGADRARYGIEFGIGPRLVTMFGIRQSIGVSFVTNVKLGRVANEN